MIVYLVGSLRNPRVLEVSKDLRAAGHECVDDWYASGPEADDHWKAYEQSRGRSFAEALEGLAARNVFDFDHRELKRAEAVVLVAPAGKSAHLELGFAIGQGKLGYVLLDSDSDRWDVMYRFATRVVPTVEALVNELAYRRNPPTGVRR